MILVSIVGDFYSSVLPIFYEFKDRIKTHIVIYDDFKNDVVHARKIINGTLDFAKKHNLDIKSYAVKMDEDSFDAIHKLVKIIEKYVTNDEELTINITDGLANIGVILSSTFLPRGSKILTYDRYDNEYNILTKDTMQKHKILSCTPIREHFLLKNIHIDTINDKQFAMNHQETIINLFENHASELKKFANYLTTTIDPSLKNFHTLIKPFAHMGIHDSNIKVKQMLITGGLFEYYIFLKVKDLTYDDIEVGVSVKHYYDTTNFIPNEFDILIMRDNHLHMIECKFTKNVGLDALVYKYMALQTLLDDDSKIIMVTGHEQFKPNLSGANSLEHLPHKRAKVSRMLLLGNPLQQIDTFVEEVKNFLAL